MWRINILCIEAQITELRAFAKQEGLNIIEELMEKQSAKIPGANFQLHAGQNRKRRSERIFSLAPRQIGAQFGGRRQNNLLLDCGHIAALKFPQFWFETTRKENLCLISPLGKANTMWILFRENVKRGLRQKVRRGEYPGLAPIGYINDSRNKKCGSG